jgi:SAM-dependent methyltransferase
MARHPHRVDYDRIAHLYDEPIRDYEVDRELLAWLPLQPGRDLGTVRILDIGCGTGKQLAANRERFPGMVMVGVDRFERMLRIALGRTPGVFWVQADGVALPLPDRSFDYATSLFSYQHIRRTPQLLGEVYRVLRPGGRFLMRNIDPWASANWLVYRYFPEALALDHGDFLPAEAFATLMGDLGFRDVRIERDDVSRDESLRAFLAYASQRHRASQLLAIPDAAYDAGLQRLRGALQIAPGGDVVVRSEIVLITVAGDKPA